MDITAVLQAFIKGSSDRANVASTRAGSLLTTQYGLPYAKWVAEGKGYQVGEATAVAAVIALPTTTAGLTIQNGEPDNGKWYVVHSVFAQIEASGAAVQTVGLAHCIGMNRVAAATQDVALTSIKPLLGGSGPYAGLCIVDLAATVVDDLWKPVGSQISNAVASNGAGQIDTFLDGLVILKPKAQYSLKLVGTATSVTGRLGVRWFEVDANELN